MWEVSFSGSKLLPRGRRINIARMQTRLAEAGRKITARLRLNQRMAFGEQGHTHHGGRNWRELLPSTIRKKGHATILVRKGKMRRQVSVTKSAASFKIVNGRVTWTISGTNNAAYSVYHQFGFTHKTAGWVAPRPPIVWTKQDKVDVEQAVAALFTTTPPRKPPGRKR